MESILHGSALRDERLLLPNLKADPERLRAFLELLPATVPCALEFRHPSWLEGETPALLRARGVALCAAETDDEPAPPLDAQAAFGYVRLRRSDYSSENLSEWALRLRGLGWRDAFVFFKHEVAGPRLAEELLALASKRPASVRPAQRDRAAG